VLAATRVADAPKRSAPDLQEPRAGTHNILLRSTRWRYPAANQSTNFAGVRLLELANANAQHRSPRVVDKTVVIDIGVCLIILPVIRPRIVSNVEHLEQVARAITHLDIFLSSAAILAQRVDDRGNQVEFADLQDVIKSLTMPLIESGPVLYVDWKPVRPRWNVRDMRCQIRNGDKSHVPRPLRELLCIRQPIAQ
jgi:hypothetical protein